MVEGAEKGDEIMFTTGIITIGVVILWVLATVFNVKVNKGFAWLVIVLVLGLVLTKLI